MLICVCVCLCMCLCVWERGREHLWKFPLWIRRDLHQPLSKGLINCILITFICYKYRDRGMYFCLSTPPVSSTAEQIPVVKWNKVFIFYFLYDCGNHRSADPAELVYLFEHIIHVREKIKVELVNVRPDQLFLVFLCDCLGETGYFLKVIFQI